MANKTGVVMASKRSTLLMGIGIITAALLSACTLGGHSFVVGEVEREAHSVQMPNTNHISMSIDMTVGRLSVAGGNSELLEADFCL